MEISNQEKITAVENESNVFSELTKYLTYFGVFTAFFGFIALSISWFYSKGFLIKFGFNSYTPNLYDSFEKYPNIGIIYSAILILLLSFGYLFGKKMRLEYALPKTLIHIFFWLVVLSNFTIITIYRLTNEVTAIIYVIMFCNPLFIVFGFLLSNLRNIVKNILMGLNIFSPVIIIYVILNVTYGSMILGTWQANRIMESRTLNKSALFFGNYPLVINAMISTDSISSNIHPVLKYGKFIYESSDTTQIQLIIMDDHSYYLFEKTKFGNKSYSISKEIISQIVFK